MSFNTRKFRDALGQFATGVCLATGVDRSGQAFGMTINSFASVSLEPPLVLWSLQKNSEMCKQWEQVDHYGVCILGKDQQALSNYYATPGQHDLQSKHYRLGRNGVPLLRRSLANFECRIVARHDGGDHIILLGQVLDFEQGTQTDPLLFFSGRYGELH